MAVPTKSKDEKKKEEEEKDKKKRCKPIGSILYCFFFLIGLFLTLFGLLLLPFAILFKCMCICCAPFVDLVWWLIKAPVKLGKCISDACCC